MLNIIATLFLVGSVGQNTDLTLDNMENDAPSALEEVVLSDSELQELLEESGELLFDDSVAADLDSESNEIHE